MSPARSIVACLLPFPLVLSAHAAQAQARWDDYPPLPGKVQPPSYDVPASSVPSAPATPEPPRAPEPPSAPFGAQGQFVLDGDTNIGISSTRYDASSASSFSGEFSPSLSYFVLKNFSLGLALGIEYADNVGYGPDSSLVETKSSSFSIGPRFGLNIPLGSAVSWWLTGTLGIEANHTSQSLVSGSSISTSTSAGAPNTSQDGPWFSLYLPLLVHPTPHFFMGAGPNLFHELAALQGGPNVGDQRTSIGAGFIVGGYWGGTPDAPSSPATEPVSAAPARSPRFGEQGQVVFSNELVAAIGSTAFAGTSSSVVSGSLAVGADFFFVDHVSMGLALNAGWSSSSGLDASGNTVTNDDTSYGIAFRFGVEIPLATWLSLYPRLSLGVEQGSLAEQSVAGQDSYTYQEVWVGGYAPLIVRVAPHFFAGFGPSISRDVSSTATFPEGQQESNPATSVGAGFIVGGWL